MTRLSENESQILYTRKFNTEDATDIGNAQHFAALNRGKLLYCHSWRSWLVWDGKRWKKDDENVVMKLAKQVPADMFRIGHELDLPAAMAFAGTSSNKPRLNAMIALAQSELPVRADELDKDPWLLNCPNGTIDLQTGKLLPHDPSYRITKIASTNYLPDAEAPRWDQFLDEVFSDDPTIRPFLARYFGYCLTGCVREQVFAIFAGDGSNGKSTLLTAILDTLGLDFAMTANADLLMENRKNSHPTDIADLFGKRLALCVESESTQQLASATVKALTGGDAIRARHMKQDFWEFQPTHKLVLATNYTPIIKDAGYGIARRLLLVRFKQRFDVGRRDNHLADQLRLECPGILAWMVRGCLQWQSSGLDRPQTVEWATTEYLKGQDLVGRFVAERCVTGQREKVYLKTLRAAYAAWCQENGVQDGKRDLQDWLSQRGFISRTSNGVMYDGIAVKPCCLDELEAPEAIFTLTRSS